MALAAENQDDSWQSWSLLANGGEVAALLEAVSKDKVSSSYRQIGVYVDDHQVEFNFDIETFPTIFLDSDSYNTRRLSEYQL